MSGASSLARAMSVRARAALLSRRASAAERYQAKGSAGTSCSARSRSVRARPALADRDLGAGAIEMRLAAQLLAEIGRGQRRIQRLQRARRLAGGEPGIAGLDPEIGAARLACRLRLARGGS